MRSVPEWIGKTDDEDPPPRVKLRVFDRKLGRCHRCARKVTAGETWTCEHIIAVGNARPGESVNRESNLGVTCSNCLQPKNAEDAAEKSKVATIRKKHLGLHKAKRPFTKRADPWGKQWLAKQANGTGKQS